MGVGQAGGATRLGRLVAVFVNRWQSDPPGRLNAIELVMAYVAKRVPLAAQWLNELLHEEGDADLSQYGRTAVSGRTWFRLAVWMR